MLLVLILLPAMALHADATAVNELLAQLDAPDPERRETAMGELMLSTDLTDEQLAAALRSADVPEKRHRLTLIAMHRFFARMNPSVLGNIGAQADGGTGSIGIDIDARNIIRPNQVPGLTHSAMLISRTRPGFPGFAVLRPGDIVLGFDGQPFGPDLDQTDFINGIQRYSAGQTMQLEVLRNGQRLTIPIKLDSLRRLQEIHARLAEVSDPAIYPAWKDHLAAMLTDAPAPAVMQVVDPDPSRSASVHQPDVPDPAHVVPRGENLQVQVLPGGQIQIRGEIRGQLQIRNGQVIVTPPGGQPQIIAPQRQVPEPAPRD
jgi:hypothetical protein